jgi:hypothetical protein
MTVADHSNRQNAYVAYYTAQAGGSLPYYKGAASMKGYGFGSWFMNLFRRAIPIVAPIAKAAATRFVSSARQNLEQGRSLGESLKRGAVDAGSDALAEGVQVVKKKMRGEGMKRRKPAGSARRKVPTKRAKKATVASHAAHTHQHGHGKKRGRKRGKNPVKGHKGALASFQDNF